MIGHCSGCGLFGEVDVLPVPSGAQRLVCHGCSNGWGPPTLPAPDRFRILVTRLQDQSLAPAEERDLRFALEGIVQRSGGRSQVARTLLGQLLENSSMNPARSGARQWPAGGPTPPGPPRVPNRRAKDGR